ncbi:hypothetical protein [Robiginitalea sp. SC105]|uniref:hypothetical protein n=1 Tax=Robiginitalea sp. SC105 TaxID=2762332 RepID=UPI00163981B0|nr:hypothetical protein [Robiginitalea sp. SC105]MBC2839555.1 hypothetical protein [Robiginitalea sp. SC105]
MKKQVDIFTSLTRISDLAHRPFEVEILPREQWANGDYVVCEIEDAGGNSLQLELSNGRMRGVIGGEWVVGAFGIRYATLEATGRWDAISDDLKMHVLTGAGLFGKLTSKSVFLPPLMQGVYRGHAMRQGRKLTMSDFVGEVPDRPFELPVILFFGTSMSAGKTTSARIVTHLFKSAGYRVIGGKLAGAGRYKDILAMKDVGAVAVFDFVDVGLPSSICPVAEYCKRLRGLLNRMAAVDADVAVVEIGASPLEPYNGSVAIKLLGEQIRFSILSASDPYAVRGLMHAFGRRPDLVTGVASNTLAGVELVKRLCSVPAINLINPSNMPELRRMLRKATGLAV